MAADDGRDVLILSGVDGDASPFPVRPFAGCAVATPPEASMVLPGARSAL